MSARPRIKDALDLIPGVTGYASEPANKAPGTAWPVLREFTRDGVLCGPYTATYEVFAVLNNNHPTAASDHAEQLLPPLVEALEQLGEWVQPADVVQIQFDTNQTVPGLRVRINTDPEEGSL